MKVLPLLLLCAVVMSCGSSADPDVEAVYDLTVAQIEADKGDASVTIPDAPTGEPRVEKEDDETIEKWGAGGAEVSIATDPDGVRTAFVVITYQKDGKEERETGLFKETGGKWSGL